MTKRTISVKFSKNDLVALEIGKHCLFCTTAEAFELAQKIRDHACNNALPHDPLPPREDD